MTKDIILSKFLKNNLTVCPVCKVKQFKIDRRGALICKHGHESKVCFNNCLVFFS